MGYVKLAPPPNRNWVSSVTFWSRIDLFRLHLVTETAVVCLELNEGPPSFNPPIKIVMHLEISRVVPPPQQSQ